MKQAYDEKWGHAGAVHAAAESGFIAWWPGNMDAEFTKKAYKHGFLPPYAPGERFVKEAYCIYHTINHVRRQDGRSFSEVSDGLVAYKADGYGSIKDLKDRIRLMSGADFEGIEVKGDRCQSVRSMPEWASRYILTLGPPVPGRLGEVGVSEMQQEGVYASLMQDPCDMAKQIKDKYRDEWNAIYPRHPWSSDRWTWAYPVKWRRR
jgi:hypothetical protein